MTNNETNNKNNNDNNEINQIMTTAINDSRSHRRTSSNAAQAFQESNGPSIADLTGGFGYFQLFLAVLVFIRYCSLALMTSSGPLLAPEVEFKCLIPDQLRDLIELPQNETLDHFLLNKCEIPLKNSESNHSYKCQQFWFNKTISGTTMTDSLELVCDRAYLKSTFQSAISLGVVLACILSGPISDQHGRLFVIRLCFLWSLLWGCVSYFANNFQLYSLARACVTFGDSSLVGSLSLVMIELIPAQSRGMILILVYTGWSMGVMFMPFICDYLMNYKLATLFTIIIHLVTCVPLILVEESVRWSMVMGNFNSAKSELKRIHRWNGISPNNFEQAFTEAQNMYMTISDQSELANGGDTREEAQKFSENRCRYIFDGLKNFFKGIWDSYKRIGEFFQSWKLALTTLVIIWISINGELFYMLFVLINSDVGEAKLANYIIGFGMELLATLVGILMTSYMSRRLSVLTTMIFISFTCLTLSFTYKMTLVSVIVMNLAKLAISNLTSLSWVLANESFPTTLRQTGSGITGSIGSFGAVAAPFVRTELTKMFGFGSVMFTLGIIVFLSAWISLLIKETKDTELPDNLAQMNEIEIDNSERNDTNNHIQPNSSTYRNAMS